MSQLSAAFEALKQTDYEKEIITKPLIHFYPSPGHLWTGKKEKIELSVNPDDASNKNTFTTTYHILDHGTVEDIIDWRRTLTDVIKKKPLRKPEARFQMTRNILERAAVTKFDTFVAKICNQPQKDEKGADIGARGSRKKHFD